MKRTAFRRVPLRARGGRGSAAEKPLGSAPQGTASGATVVDVRGVIAVFARSPRWFCSA